MTSYLIKMTYFFLILIKIMFYSRHNMGSKLCTSQIHFWDSNFQSRFVTMFMISKRGMTAFLYWGRWGNSNFSKLITTRISKLSQMTTNWFSLDTEQKYPLSHLTQYKTWDSIRFGIAQFFLWRTCLGLFLY